MFFKQKIQQISLDREEKYDVADKNKNLNRYKNIYSCEKIIKYIKYSTDSRNILTQTNIV